MISGLGRIKNQIALLSSMAVLTCLSIGLFYHFITRNESILEKFHQMNLSQLSTTDTECLLNVSVWTEEICRQTFHSLEWFPKFPDFPDRRQCSKEFSLALKNDIYNTTAIKRIQVSFTALEPGFYQLRANTRLPLKIHLCNADQSSSRNLVLLSNGSTRLQTIFSRNLFVDKNSYLEIITYHLPGGDRFLGIDWLVPGSTHFVPAFSSGLRRVHEIPYRSSSREVSVPDRSLLVGFIPRVHVVSGFPVCTPSDIKAWRNEHRKFSNTSVYTEANQLDKFTREILELIMASLQKAAPSKYPVYKINKVEVAPNPTSTRATRLLVDLNLTVDGLDYIERFGEYLFAYYHGNQLELCRPLCYQWERTVSLNFVFLTNCSKKDTPWGMYFIENMIELLQKSLEVNFRMVITACGEEEQRRYENKLGASDIDWSQVVLLEGVSNRSRAMKYVLSLLENKSIVVLCESRVRMPAGIAEEIRKHTFKTAMAYSPIPYKLECGYFPENARAKGVWCPNCTAVTSMYKEDWKKLLSPSSENTDILKDMKGRMNPVDIGGLEILEIELKGLYKL